MYEKNPKAVRYSLGTYHFLRNRVDLATGYFCSRLTVVLNQILYKLRVAEVDGAGVVLVHRGNLSHVLIGKREVEDVEVLRHALLMTRLGNGHDAALGEPTEGYLGCTLAIFGADG